MKLDGLHLLLTHQCTFECDHCFVFGSPFQSGTMTIDLIKNILKQAKEAKSIEWIYFEGGEPFLYYQTMLAGINAAANAGFKIGIVTNSYWATSEEDALLCMEPLIGKVQDFTISSDLFHYTEKVSQQSKIVTRVAEKLKIPIGVICIELPEYNAVSTIGQIPPESSSVMYRGRAAVKLTLSATLYPAKLFTSCPHENLIEPGRVHIDPFGNLHICQGLAIGNLNHKSITEICSEYDAANHPIIGPLLEGGPIRLAEKYNLHYNDYYADACHLCYESRKLLRNEFPAILRPDQMYCVPGE
jgi:Radical SAM superfamily/4Fe-4S single cluster domain